MSKFDVIGIGNACIDVVDRIDYGFLDQFQMRKSHCVYIDRARMDEMKKALPHHELKPGGSVANTIHCLRALNLKVGFQGIIANDSEGTTFKNDLIQNDISAFLSVTDQPDLGTTQVFCLATEDGDRSFASYDGAARTLAFQHLNMDSVAQSKVTYFDGYTLYSPHAEDAFAQTVKVAHDAGHLAAFNPADLSIIQSFPEKTKHLASIADIILCNLTEARAIFGYDTLQDCATHLPRIKRAGAVTNGSGGAMVFNSGEILYIAPTTHNVPPVDTNGAGDHFAAGILYGLIRRLSLPTMANLAHLCAQDGISHMGARPLGSLAHLIPEAENMVA